MELHQLRYFVAVAEEQHFSRAAERMRVAQPSLSQQIQKLEAEVGQPLFNRLPRKVTLTEAGERLLSFARRILTEVADAKSCLEEETGAAGGAVSIGVIPTIAPYVLRPLLTAFRQRRPGSSVQVQEDVTENLVRALENGEIDLALVSTCRGGSGMHRERLGQEAMMLVLPEGHRLARRRRVSWRDLAPDESLVMLHESHCLSQQIGQWCRRHGMRERTTLPTGQISTVVSMVAAGLGISMIPAMAHEKEAGQGCAFIALEEAPPREINIIRNPARYASRAATALAEVAREVVGKFVSQEGAACSGTSRR